MTKHKIYRYLGRNGIITTPILLEGTDPILMYRLIAGSNKILTDGINFTCTIDVFPDELENWREIPMTD